MFVSILNTQNWLGTKFQSESVWTGVRTERRVVSVPKRRTRLRRFRSDQVGGKLCCMVDLRIMIRFLEFLGRILEFYGAIGLIFIKYMWIT